MYKVFIFRLLCNVDDDVLQLSFGDRECVVLLLLVGGKSTQNMLNHIKVCNCAH